MLAILSYKILAVFCKCVALLWSSAQSVSSDKKLLQLATACVGGTATCLGVTYGFLWNDEALNVKMIVEYVLSSIVYIGAFWCLLYLAYDLWFRTNQVWTYCRWEWEFFDVFSSLKLDDFQFTHDKSPMGAAVEESSAPESASVKPEQQQEVYHFVTFKLIKEDVNNASLSDDVSLPPSAPHKLNDEMKHEMKDDLRSVWKVASPEDLLKDAWRSPEPIGEDFATIINVCSFIVWWIWQACVVGVMEDSSLTMYCSILPISTLR